MTCKPMIVFDTNKEIPFFFINIPQTITYSNFSEFEWLGKFHHGDGGETIPLKIHVRIKFHHRRLATVVKLYLPFFR